jgi:hypothetical protein
MEMSKVLRRYLALGFIICILTPTASHSLQYPPGDPRNGTLSGHPSGGDEAHLAFTRALSNRSIRPTPIWIYLPFLGKHIRLPASLAQLVESL